MRVDDMDDKNVNLLITKVKRHLSLKEDYTTRPIQIGWKSDDADLDLHKIIANFTTYYYKKIAPKQLLKYILNGINPFEQDFLNLCTEYYKYLRRPRYHSTVKTFNFGDKISSGITLFKKTDSAIDHLSHNLPPLSGTVLVKPNFVSKEQYPETSDIQFLTALIGIIKSKGPSKVIIADGPSIFSSPDEIFKQEEIVSLGNIADIEIRNILAQNDITKINLRSQNGPLTDIFIPSFLFDIDILINLSLFKEHRNVGFSGAMKNMMGLLPGFERLRFHELKLQDFIRAIIQLNHIIKSDLVIMDARKILRYAQQRMFGGFESNGFGIIIGSNVFEVDSIALNYARKSNINVKYRDQWVKEIENMRGRG